MMDHIVTPNMSKKDYIAEEEQQARVLLSSILIVATAALFFGVVMPSYKSMRSTQGRIVALASTNSQQEINDSIADVAYASMVRYAADLERAETALPHIGDGVASDVPGLVATLEAIVEREVGGIFLDELRIAPDEELIPIEGGLALRKIKLSGLAGTGSVSRLLDALRSALHLFEPTALSMKPAGEGVVEFTIELERAVILE